MREKLNFEKMAMESLAKRNFDEQSPTQGAYLRQVKFRSAILECIHKSETVTQADIANALGYSKRTVIRYMKQMQQEGLIVREGSNKTGRWKLGKNQV